MGVDPISLAFMGFTAARAVGSMETARSNANAQVEQGDVETQNVQRQTNLNANTVRTSFLNNGFAMTGTANLATQSVYNTGDFNIASIANNTNNQASNTMAAGRTAAITAIAQGLGGSALSGSMGSMFTTGASYLPDSFDYALNNAGFGNTAYNILQNQDTRMGS